MQTSSFHFRTSVIRFSNTEAMKVSLVLTVLLFRLVIGDELQTDKQQTEINTGKQGYGKGNRNPWKRETKAEVCNDTRNVAVQSVYVCENFTQLFIESFDGSKVWTTVILGRADKYPEYQPRFNRPNELGKFRNMDRIRESHGIELKRVSASFLLFSESTEDIGYLVMGLNAFEFVGKKYYYSPTGNVKPITDFFKEGDKKLLMPEDKLEEVVSVALIKWVEKDKIKDHAIYKIILKTVTKKLVKAYFKVKSKGEIMSLNSEPFVPSAEPMQEEDEFKVLEESALYDVREKDKHSIGYQFTSKFAFPIYYDYNPETKTYKEYQMRTKTGFNAELEKLGDKLPYWNRYIVPTETWLGCPETTFCLGRSFDAVFFAEDQYYALYYGLVYTLALISDRPSFDAPLRSRFPIFGYDKVDAAFSLGVMAFFIQNEDVHYMANISEKNVDSLETEKVFPGIDVTSISAVITLDKGKETDKFNVNELQPSKRKSARLRKNRKREERADQRLEEDIPKEKVYIYVSSWNIGSVYLYEMEAKTPPKFKLIANKTYNQVNAALPHYISLAFTAEGKVVTMFNHFMIEQSSSTFFTQTENQATFTLVDKYFGCQREKVEIELTKEFVRNYVKFAGPKAGVNVFVDPVATQESTETAFDVEATDKVKDGSMSCRISTAIFIIQAVVTILFR